ncbi:MAG TPA: alpha/beta hydrolase-fold protein [Halanaerobiales bacterium]|nr:alpha/beta hydrolase-fold protein [Halanaerobiales bacterium]
METNNIEPIKDYIKNNNQLSLEEVLKEFEIDSTPLVEKKEAGYLISFLYEEKNLKNIAVVGSFPGFDLKNQKLYQVADSNIWLHSFEVDNPVNFTYGFIKNYDEDNHELDIRDKIKKDPFNDKDITIYQNKDEILDLSCFDMVLDKTIDKYFNKEYNEEPLLQEKQLESEIYGVDRRYWTLENGTNDAYEGIFLCTDGYTYANDKELLKVLHNLRVEQRIPNLLFVFVENEDRGIELAADQTFKKFLNNELLEEIKKDYKIELKDKDNIICGKSLGGLTAFYNAYDSDIFNSIISHSGTFIWGYPDERERDFLFEEIENNDFKLKNIYLDVGTLEDEFVPMWFMSLIDVNKRMKNTIKNKTERLFFDIFKGGHDYYCWRKNTVSALLKFYN